MKQQNSILILLLNKNNVFSMSETVCHYHDYVFTCQGPKQFDSQISKLNNILGIIELMFIYLVVSV